jgi:predicted naringenin-chalcone synthase
LTKTSSVRILSLGLAFPEFTVTQEQALDYLGYTGERARKIFLNTGIEKRYLWCDARWLREAEWQRLVEEYERGAPVLSCQAIGQAMDDGLFLDEIGMLVFCSVSGYAVPSQSFPIAKELGMSEDMEHENLLGQGCQSAVPGLRAAYRFVRQTGRKAMVVNTELCSATYFPAPETDVENVVANALFGDASSTTILGLSDDPKYPEIVGFGSYFSGAHMNLLGYRWVNGRLKCRLDPRVPKVVPILAVRLVNSLLRRHKLQKSDISHWIVHPGGKRVLENIEKHLGLAREQTQHSWDVMREVGNVSSATLGIIGKVTQQKKPQGYGIALTMGAGTSVEAALLRWG